MKQFFSINLDVHADLLINISAGWFMLVFIEPVFDEKSGLYRTMVRLLFGVLTLGFANFLRGLYNQKYDFK